MDLAVRKQALNTNESFIVQAPAGSGKTELLTQRYLALLAKVSEPEEIVALTFTRKAAQEMAHRILAALQDAENNVAIQSAHQQHTRALAEKALHHNKSRDWQILNHPNRLRITTFDAFALNIYQSIPQYQHQKIERILNHPEQCYEQAILDFYDLCRQEPHYQGHLEQLLTAVNNKVDQLFSGLLSLLATRDNWLHAIAANKHLDQAAHVQKLENILNFHWQAWGNSLAPSLKTELLHLTHRLLTVVKAAENPLHSWSDFDAITLPQLLCLKQLITTQTGDVRQEWNHHVGLKNDLAPTAIIKALKADSRSLLAALSECHDFIATLQHLAELPHPQAFDLDWNSLQSFYTLLPLLVACLHLTFEEQGGADFSFFAQQALFALEGSDIALYFDSQLQHLLIDEFQDTSWTQLAFIKELTRNWQSAPNKTLFLVGDPMQSIYRFRSADVSIFLNIQAQGLEGIPITPIHLTQNFRSSAQLIEGFNGYFKHIFPKQDEVCFGGVKFHEAIPALEADVDAGIEACYFADMETQFQYIIEQMQSSAAKDIKSAAILVRSRKHLPILLQLFERAKLKYQGVDLFPLGHLMHIRDIWQLTQILLDPGQRAHELAVLHSPFCGLSLSDLSLLAEAFPKSSLIRQVDTCNIPQHLSLDAQQRLLTLVNAIAEAEYHLHQAPLVDVIFKLCQRLHFDAIFNAKQKLDLERFFMILDQASVNSPWPSLRSIQSILEASFVSNMTNVGLQVMTIHKSKGLEFDWVFLPNMGDSGIRHHSALFYSFQANYPGLKPDLICLPQLTANKLQYIYKWHDALQEKYEQQRLCYVAFTRAKKRLFLLDKSQKYRKDSFRNLFAENFFQEKQLNHQTQHHACAPKTFQRLPLPSHVPSYPPLQKEVNSLHFQDNQSPKSIGQMLHLILQWVCEFHPTTFAEIPWHILKPKMQQLGWKTAQQNDALSYIKTLIEAFWHHPIGQWIKASYSFEKNEYELLVRDGQIVRTLILDRCFIDNDCFWIIDFKTAHEKTGYKVQLDNYAKAIRLLYPQHSIHCGIFYLSTQKFDQWAYQEALDLIHEG
ncbi:MAG: hypothetical protein EBY16_01295 [Gammaproteobacteria bacterium]|nr:hypothetical protein [Gammaproteobacteria bacterium]